MFDQKSGDDNQSVRTPAQLAARSQLSREIGTTAFEMVEITGILATLNDHTANAARQLDALSSGANAIETAVSKVVRNLETVEEDTSSSVARAQTALDDMKDGAVKANSVASWVQDLGPRMKPMEERLNEVRRSARLINDIATEIDMLSINARIEAARAGEQGRGFNVVADAIGSLSQQTHEVTRAISDELQAFSDTVSAMIAEAAAKTEEATQSLEATRRNDGDVAAIADSLHSTAANIKSIAAEARDAGERSAQFVPVFNQVNDLINDTAHGIHDSQSRFNGLTDNVERLVRLDVSTGAATEDHDMIKTVTQTAAQIALAMERAVETRKISETDLFDQTYVAIPGSDPQQVMTKFTQLTDTILPEFQEPVPALDSRIVFCAAVDRNGYLPTHNLKFCKPQGNDPTWNAANCRNRRIFDDRVGLKAGRNTEPFLLQVYRRDMGGGQTVLMKDLSAPIYVNGRHWGGLRLAYKPE